MTALLVVLAVLGWGAAGAMAGLWWGERGRRLDLAWITGGIVPRGREETSPQPTRIVDPDEIAVRAIEEEDLVNHLLEEAATEGRTVTLDEVKADARRMMQELEQVDSGGLG